jgi:hypothetical protein
VFYFSIYQPFLFSISSIVIIANALAAAPMPIVFPSRLLKEVVLDSDTVFEVVLDSDTVFKA